MITVALPNYCNPFVWFAMESLCNQKTNHEWELIVYEDSDEPLGQEFYESYLPRLSCKSFGYLYSEPRVALNKKWLKMAEISHPSSLGIILQASDCYSEPYRIETAHHWMEKGVDWVHSPSVYFYNVNTRQVMLFQLGEGTGSNMAISKKCIQQLPQNEDKWSSVDYWLRQNMPSDIKMQLDLSDNWKLGCDTDGHNRISIARRKYYNSPRPPFHKTSATIQNILPIDIIKKLDECES